MVKKYKKNKTVRISSPARVGDDAFNILKAMGWSPEKARLAGLWKDWDKIMGEEFAWTIPLGHHGRILFLGAGDSMELQELGLQSALILERVNKYMEAEYFSRLRVSISAAKD